MDILNLEPHADPDVKVAIVPLEYTYSDITLFAH